ncbi:hypothetical protein RRG08_041586 [Elysia crispata]|uniref:Integrase catalytic domain-containing protein n=1 Tax=Elysia crispata TaxID=231223 RepID=A0AAE1AZ26_9GAST|nr:hypothetical protein RRG08_041586 [Elysia crispata]
MEAQTTSAYHLQANGMVERLHLHLKAALKARITSPKWLVEVPMVLLGIRSSWRADLDCSSVELVYGPTLHIPREFLPPSDARTIEFRTFPTNHALNSTVSVKYVYVRKNSHQNPLQRDR